MIADQHCYRMRVTPEGVLSRALLYIVRHTLTRRGDNPPSGPSLIALETSPTQHATRAVSIDADAG